MITLEQAQPGTKVYVCWVALKKKLGYRPDKKLFGRVGTISHQYTDGTTVLVVFDHSEVGYNLQLKELVLADVLD